jgi:hypothetical protein
MPCSLNPSLYYLIITPFGTVYWGLVRLRLRLRLRQNADYFHQQFLSHHSNIFFTSSGPTFFRTWKWTGNVSTENILFSFSTSWSDIMEPKTGHEQGDQGPMLWFFNFFSYIKSATKLAFFFVQNNDVVFFKIESITMVFKKNAIFSQKFGKNRRKIVIIT